jgi:16S rRNA (adenine1518-N6/adenine1519-N6)-dimethyltransferase
VSSSRRPLKALGQNFLVDNNIIDKIIRSADIKPEDCVLEIGPGRGALTEYLARKAGRLVLIEYDHALAAALKERYAADARVTVVDDRG